LPDVPQTVPNPPSNNEPRQRHYRIAEARPTLQSGRRLGERILQEEKAATAAFVSACRMAARKLHAL
jgi:DNA-binding LacI/PurR family transcriptional regulator